MKTLVIPDFHEQVEKIPALEACIDKAERIVALGDWLDTFKKHKVKETLDFILKYRDDKRWTRLIGNHCAHYMFSHPYFRCSGYTPETQELWDRYMPIDFLHEWKIWTEVDDFLVSHAGFHSRTIHLRTPEIHEEALERARAGDFHEIWMPGQDVGGPPGMIGGPNWMRWQRMEPLENMPQIVGHTKDSYVRVKDDKNGKRSYCLDTALRHIAWVEGSKVTVELL